MKKNNLLIAYFIILLLPYNVFAAKEKPLPIPPILENTSTNPKVVKYALTVEKGVTEFVPGAPNITYGYNGPLLGPTIRAKRGQRVEITITNKLREYTTVHWHGMLLPGEMDGGPHQVVRPDSKWQASFTVNQPAATTWYHPHGIGNTASQVYRGLAGMFILDDEESLKLDLPKEYGVDDIPLIVQDRRIAKDGTLLYLTNMNDIMQGMTGNTMLVNGAIKPFVEVPRGKVRFRLLNGSNARLFNFFLSDKSYFWQIASDGGLLEKPLKMKRLQLSPGERAEIIVDFSQYNSGDFIFLKSGRFKLIRLAVGKNTKKSASIPDKLTTIKDLSKTDVVKRRFFGLTGMGHMVAINGKQMDLWRIDEQIKINTTEIWEITSRVGMMGMMMRSSNVVHNFHAHGIQFQILERNGSPPPANERGWKDTLQIDDGERVKLITRFHYPGDFMYHCHILEHEDNGMMGQFRVAK